MVVFLFLHVGQQKLPARLEVFKLLSLWDEERQIIITCGTQRSYLGRESEKNNNVPLLGTWFLASGKAVSFSSQGCLLEIFGKSLLTSRLRDQKYSKCFMETALLLPRCFVSPSFCIWINSYVGRSVPFDLHSFITVIKLTQDERACIGSMSLMTLLCKDFSVHTVKREVHFTFLFLGKLVPCVAHWWQFWW